MSSFALTILPLHCFSDIHSHPEERLSAKRPARSRMRRRISTPASCLLDARHAALRVPQVPVCGTWVLGLSFFRLVLGFSGCPICRLCMCVLGFLSALN
jgi:hypothetical protein